MRIPDSWVDLTVKNAMELIGKTADVACEEYNAAEGKVVAEFLKKCKKGITQSLDEQIKKVEGWK